MNLIKNFNKFLINIEFLKVIKVDFIQKKANNILEITIWFLQMRICRMSLIKLDN